MDGANIEEHLRAFLVGALLTWLVLDFGTKRRHKKFKKTEKDQAQTDCLEGRFANPKINGMTITIYGTDWCGDCVRAKKFFADNQIEYHWVDLEKDENEKFVESEVLRRNNGKKSIPVIVFDDDSHLTEPTNAQLAEKLGLDK